MIEYIRYCRLINVGDDRREFKVEPFHKGNDRKKTGIVKASRERKIENENLKTREDYYLFGSLLENRYCVFRISLRNN